MKGYFNEFLLRVFAWIGRRPRLADFLWRVFAWIVSRRPVARYLILRAKRTPFFSLPGYMDRWWLFNPYKDSNDADVPTYDPRWPSIRVHHILRADLARHPHDHPWDARTIILCGDYTELRARGHWAHDEFGIEGWDRFWRRPGDTARLDFLEFHHISSVSDGGVYTMFITWPWRGRWGFLVNGKKVHWRDYADNGEPDMTSRGSEVQPWNA